MSPPQPISKLMRGVGWPGNRAFHFDRRDEVPQQPRPTPALGHLLQGLAPRRLGLALALGGLDALLFGTDNKVVPTLVADHIIHVGGAALSLVSLITAAFGVVLMVVAAVMSARLLRSATSSPRSSDAVPS